MLKAVQNVYEVCNIFCATANDVEVVLAETAQGRGILGVVDGLKSKGVESEKDARDREGAAEEVRIQDVKIGSRGARERGS